MAFPILKHIRSVAGLALLAWLPLQSALAGIVVGGTRVVYPAQAREVTVQLRNTGESPALVQAWLDEGDAKQLPDDSKAPFIVTPPISRVEPGSGQALRMFFTGAPLPADRESVFWLNVLEIPPAPVPVPAAAFASQASAADGTLDQNYLQLAFRSRLKVFYRPRGLAGTANEAPASLQWRLEGGVLRVSNPTPYHVTLTRTELRDAAGGSAVADQDGLMLAPGQSRDVGPQPQAGAWTGVSFTTINDYGGLVTREALLGPRP